jgi:hypothetical protein
MAFQAGTPLAVPPSTDLLFPPTWRGDRIMKAVGLLLLGGFVAMNVWASQAHALPQFKKAFMEKYVDNSTDQAFKAAATKANCGICHAPGTNRKLRNAYGKALEKITGGHVMADRNAAQGDDAKKAVIDAAVKKLVDEGFEKAEADKSPAGPTFGDQIKAGKLPASK